MSHGIERLGRPGLAPVPRHWASSHTHPCNSPSLPLFTSSHPSFHSWLTHTAGQRRSASTSILHLALVEHLCNGQTEHLSRHWTTCHVITSCDPLPDSLCPITTHFVQSSVECTHRERHREGELEGGYLNPLRQFASLVVSAKSLVNCGSVWVNSIR